MVIKTQLLWLKEYCDNFILHYVDEWRNVVIYVCNLCAVYLTKHNKMFVKHQCPQYTTSTDRCKATCPSSSKEDIIMIRTMHCMWAIIPCKTEPRVYVTQTLRSLCWCLISWTKLFGFYVNLTAVSREKYERSTNNTLIIVKARKLFY
jgi:hypothetical protein